MKVVLNGEFCFVEAPWLSWADVAYGMDKNFLEPKEVVEYSLKPLSESSTSDHYELACSTAADMVAVQVCLGRLACTCKQDVLESKKIWLFLTLLWVYKNKDIYDDPLGVVEELYADFDYPEMVAPAVRYMPAIESSLGGDGVVLNNWLNVLSLLREELKTLRYS